MSFGCRGSTRSSRSSSSSSSFGISASSSWFRSFRLPSFFQQMPKLNGLHDVQVVAASLSAFIDWDALFKVFHSSEEHDRGTIIGCKVIESGLQDCTKKYGSDNNICRCFRTALREECNFEPFIKSLKELGNFEDAE